MYDWDKMDGYDELPRDLQEKFERAVIEGRVGPEDWRGVNLSYTRNQFKSMY